MREGKQGQHMFVGIYRIASSGEPCALHGMDGRRDKEEHGTGRWQRLNRTRTNLAISDQSNSVDIRIDGIRWRASRLRTWRRWGRLVDLFRVLQYTVRWLLSERWLLRRFIVCTLSDLQISSKVLLRRLWPHCFFLRHHNKHYKTKAPGLRKAFTILPVSEIKVLAS